MSTTISAIHAPAPRTVLDAQRWQIASALLGLVALLAGFALVPQATALALQMGTAGNAQAVAHQAAANAAVAAALLDIASAVVVFVVVRKMRQGRNWARIVLLVLAALHLVGLLQLIGSATPAASVVLAVLIALASGVGAVLSYLPKSSDWFRAGKRTTV